MTPAGSESILIRTRVLYEVRTDRQTCNIEPCSRHCEREIKLGGSKDGEEGCVSGGERRAGWEVSDGGRRRAVVRSASLILMGFDHTYAYTYVNGKGLRDKRAAVLDPGTPHGPGRRIERHR